MSNVPKHGLSKVHMVAYILWMNTRLLCFTIAILAATLGFGCASPEQKFDRHLQNAREAIGRRQYDHALEELRAAQNFNGTDKTLLFYLATTHEGLGQLDSAMTYLKQSLSLHGADKELSQQLFRLANTRQKWDMALNALTIWSQTGAPRDSILELYYNTYRRAGYWKPASEAIDTLVAHQPGREDLRLQQAMTHAAKGDYTTALAVLDSLEKKFGPSVETFANRGTVYVSMEDTLRAEKSFRAALALDTLRSANWVNLGNILASQSSPTKKREALTCYARVDLGDINEMRLDTIITRLQAELAPPK